VVEAGKAGRVEGVEEVCRVGAGEVEAKGLHGPVAGVGSVISDTKILVWRVKGFPGSISRR
jgi:hypothetical protein